MAGSTAPTDDRVTVDRTVRFGHLMHLSTPLGLFEHALGTTPRVANGMCVDDVARGLVVTARTPDPSPQVGDLSRTYLTFLRQAQRVGGRMHNRRTAGGAWVDSPSAGDHWGRALWAFGTAAAQVADERQAALARECAAQALVARSPYLRATAYATLGAAQLLRGAPDDGAARRLMLDARRALPRPRPDGRWPWPEPRLTYANAVLPEAMLAVGTTLADDGLVGDGLALLEWLVQEQTLDAHLSVVPAGGRGPGDARPGFDQQPIEVAALAEACRAALDLTGSARWADVLHLCVAWFEGANDTGGVVRDEATGGGYDGLEPAGVNQNQGAESTLAWLSCLQLVPARPSADRS